MPKTAGFLRRLPVLWAISVAAIVLPIFVVLAYSRVQTMNRVEHGLELIAKASVARGDAVLNKTHNVLRELVAKGHTGCGEEDRKAYGDAVYNTIEIRSIGIIDQEGQRFECTDTEVFRPAIKMTIPEHWAIGPPGEIAIVAPAEDVRKQTSIFINYGHTGGRIIDAAIYPEQFWDFQDALGLGEGGAVMLVDSERRALTALRTSAAQPHTIALPKDRTVGFSRVGDDHFVYASRSEKYPIEAVAVVSVDSALGDWRRAVWACIPMALAMIALACWYVRTLYRRGFTMTERLIDAIESDALKLVYQPIVNVSNGAIENVEVLCRWDDAELGSVPPDVFVAAATRDGALPRLSEWVCRHAFKELGPMFGSTTLRRMSVNIGRDDLETGSLLDTAISNDPKMAQHLTLEITERESLSAEFERIKTVLARWRTAGARIALDDFGTGCCNLGYLRELPVDVVKIDRMFCARLDAAENQEDAAMFDAMHTLLKHRPFDLVAEGIEREGQHVAIAQRGVNYGQGWHYARPMPIAALKAWINSATSRLDGVPAFSAA